MTTTLRRRGKAQDFPPTVVQELQQIETDLGGRQAIVGLLTLAPLTPDLRYLLGLLGDPQNSAHSLAELCVIGNILPGTLLQQLGAAALLKGKVRASQAIGNGIVAVAADVMRRAAPYEEVCYRCQGTGTSTPDPTPQIPNPGPGPCETCAATGKLRYQPELERQKVAIEMAQLVTKGGGINIAVQQNAQGGSSGGTSSSFDLLQQLSDQVLYGPGGAEAPERADGDPIEGDVVDLAEEADVAAP